MSDLAFHLHSVWFDVKVTAVYKCPHLYQCGFDLSSAFHLDVYHMGNYSQHRKQRMSRIFLATYVCFVIQARC